MGGEYKYNVVLAVRYNSNGGCRSLVVDQGERRGCTYDTRGFEYGCSDETSVGSH